MTVVKSDAESGRLMPLVWDVAAIVLFAIFARLAHQTAEEPFTFINVLNTLWPFLIGVIIGWAAAGLANSRLDALAPSGIIVWIATVITGLGIWSIRNGEVPHWSFILVATAMSGLLLLGWRLAALGLRRRG